MFQQKLLSHHGFLVYFQKYGYVLCWRGIATFGSLVNTLEVAAHAHIGVGHRGFWSREENPKIEHPSSYFVYWFEERGGYHGQAGGQRQKIHIRCVLAKFADARRPSLRTRSGEYTSRS